MTKKTIGYLLIEVGVVVLVISLAADVLGIGSYPGVNWAQILGAVIGIIIALVGAWQASRKISA